MATNAVSVDFPSDGAGRGPKGPSNLSHGKLRKMEAGQGHALFGLDLLITLEWGDLHLRTLQGWQVLRFTFESAK